MVRIYFKVIGEPKGKRDQINVRTIKTQGVITKAFPQVFVNKLTRAYMNLVKKVAKKHKPKELISGAVAISLWIYKPIPKSWTKKKKSSALSWALPPITKPDWDNYSKAICDSMTGVLWVDDCQIVDADVHKRYSQEEPYVSITVWEVGKGKDQIDMATEPEVIGLSNDTDPKSQKGLISQSVLW